jgi:hypothetical protein
MAIPKQFLILGAGFGELASGNYVNGVLVTSCKIDILIITK